MIHSAYFALGIGFLALAKAKHILQGYATPKPFSDPERSAQYAVSIANKYINGIRAAGGTLEGKRVLELGPGSDLGTGLCMLGAGARFYCGFDVNPLALHTPQSLYDRIKDIADVDLTALDDPTRLRYVVQSEFNLMELATVRPFDVIVSNGAFEHFDNVPRVMRQLTALAAPGALFFSEIDLQTHSRWIREHDPNNIYRYPEWLYKAFYFPGQPNRLRPEQYAKTLAECGWEDVQTQAVATSDTDTAVLPKFQDGCLNWLHFNLSARSAPAH